jgi:anti-sigma B factor antagonist
VFVSRYGVIKVERREWPGVVDEDLTTQVVRHLDYRVLILAGEIDMHTAPGLRDQIFELIDEEPLPLVVDLTEVTFCDSTGVNIAVAARKHAAGCGVMFAFVGLQGRVDRVFRITGMRRLIPTYANLPEAALHVIGSELRD